MAGIIYIISAGLFLSGSLLITVINKQREKYLRRQNWIKFSVYLLIVNLLISVTIFVPDFFRYITIIISVICFIELQWAGIRSGMIRTYIAATVLLLIFAYFFFFFSLLPNSYLLYVILMIFVFDAFSQLSGQLFGRNKLFPRISPNKTLEGLAGGFISSLLLSVLLRKLPGMELLPSLAAGAVIAASSFSGDFLASYCKRKLGIKDFSSLIPGHGGFLDRFDSMLVSSTFMFLSYNLYL